MDHGRKSIVCPLCSSAEHELTGTHSVERLCAAWQEQFQLEIRDEFRGQDSFDERRCLSCELVFFPSELAGSAQIYAGLQRFDWYYLRGKWEHGEALRDVRAGDRLLEIGAGEGEFITRARQFGIDVHGLELNQNAARRAQELGLPVEPKLMSDLLPAQAGSYDAVCSFQVLEHVSDPYAFLEQAVRLLKPGGRLLTAVPNRDSWIRLQDNLLDLPPHHVTRWSTDCFARLSALFPLELTRTAFEPLPDYHVRPFIAMQAAQLARRWQPGRAARFVWEKMLALGPLRRRLQGQGLYACHRLIAC